MPSCVICCHVLHSGSLLCDQCMPSALCPPLSALCLISLALCGPGGFYLLFVSDIWCGSVLSCVICCHVLHSGSLLCAQCMPSALHSLPSVWSCGCDLCFAPDTFVCVHMRCFSAISCHLTTCFVHSLLCPRPSTLCLPLSALCLLPSPNLLKCLLSIMAAVASFSAL